jgi:hypothetical protein
LSPRLLKTVEADVADDVASTVMMV